MHLDVLDFGCLADFGYIFIHLNESSVQMCCQFGCAAERMCKNKVYF